MSQVFWQAKQNVKEAANENNLDCLCYIIPVLAELSVL
jgi:hypothetical protein